MKTIEQCLDSIDKFLKDNKIVTKNENSPEGWDIDKTKSEEMKVWSDILNKELRDNKTIRGMLLNSFIPEMWRQSLIQQNGVAEFTYGLKAIHTGILIGKEMMRDEPTTAPTDLIRYIQELKQEGVRTAVMSCQQDAIPVFKLGEEKIKIAQRLEELTECLFKKQ